jgi:uncharacterized membrane protein YgdD (TMEM256/DUF423 family)
MPGGIERHILSTRCIAPPSYGTDSSNHHDLIRLCYCSPVVEKAAPRTAGLCIAAAGFNGLLGVAMGAFAAHGLKATLDPAALGWVKTGADYQLWHGLALLGIGILHEREPARPLRLAGWLMVAGAILFSGSLYLLAFVGWRGFAWATPFGGLALLFGWACLLWHGIANFRAG